ncbi:alpha/beta family hydrolase [Cytobacillus purgationiresistens]|uniref:Alpha/beta-fold hydrolase n=1 Tax=Cytobacillus purgationiresistens TaxID=863449 RepID=A0ABU0APE6_9BACI|nr:alpha/beta family hydrolase [Cytobacillus purgationiresistens]MDQ0273159.1 putative alpha/beta-fold hydrolase [Cytobacillus purgationiresistens]
MKQTKQSVFTNGKALTYTHITNGADTICYMFSGSGYTYERPLLYYSTMLMLEKGYDVVHIHYGYEKGFLQSDLSKISQVITEDVRAVLLDVAKLHHYQSYLFLGKSLGTIPIAMHLMKANDYLEAKMMLLTPLFSFDEVYQSVLKTNQSTYIVIGDQDPHFDSAKIEALKVNNNIHVTTINQANHALDITPYDSLSSLDALKTVISSLRLFLK